MATRDSASLQDDGFREIQLTGKQLVFLFMATTVVSIVIFLCGVLVGRGVRGDVTVAQRSSSTQPPAEPPAGEPEPVDEVVAAEELKNPTQLPQELTYQQRLDGGNGPVAGAKPAAPAAKPPASGAAANAAAPAAAAPPAPAPASAPVAPAASPSASTAKPAEAKAPPSSTPPAGPASNADKAAAAAKSAAEPKAEPKAEAKSASEKSNTAASSAKTAPPASAASAGAFVVQVAALDSRREADQIAQRLSAKGYPAFVQEPAADSQDKFFRVRVGRFADRPSAERTVKQLAQEGPYKPWITR